MQRCETPRFIDIHSLMLVGLRSMLLDTLPRLQPHLNNRDQIPGLVGSPICIGFQQDFRLFHVDFINFI